MFPKAALAGRKRLVFCEVKVFLPRAQAVACRWSKQTAGD